MLIIVIAIITDPTIPAILRTLITKFIPLINLILLQLLYPVFLNFLFINRTIVPTKFIRNILIATINIVILKFCVSKKFILSKEL